MPKGKDQRDTSCWSRARIQRRRLALFRSQGFVAILDYNGNTFAEYMHNTSHQ